jgi:diguanylate cyclase (GGDEF)-like protein
MMAIGADLVAGAMHLALCVMSHSEHALAYTTGLAMVIMYSNIYVRTRFWLAAPTCVALLLMYVVSLWFMPNPSLSLSIPIGLVLVSTAVFTQYYLYTLEHEERLNYLLASRQKLLQQELGHANNQLERVSRVDALTQVANRRHFDQFLSQLWERARHDDSEVAIVMLDVDCFKAYNDHYGHPAGDACLVQVAESLVNSLRRPGDLVARYGGEEFIAVLHKAAPAQAEAAAERVRQSVFALALPHTDSFVTKVVTVSVGVATMRPSDRQASPQHLIALADEALYQAKNRGRNRVWVSGAGVASC